MRSGVVAAVLMTRGFLYIITKWEIFYINLFSTPEKSA